MGTLVTAESIQYWWRKGCNIAVGLFTGLAVPCSQIGIAYLTIFLAIAAAAAILHPDRRRWLTDAAAVLLTPVGIVIAIVFLFWIPSLLVSLDPMKSFEVWARTICYLGLGTILWAFLRGNADALRLAQKTLIIAAAVTVALAALNFSGGTAYIRALRMKAFEEGYAPQILKRYAAPAACLVPVLLLVALDLGRKWFAASIAIAGGLITFIYLTGSGAAALGLLIGLYCLAVSWVSRGRMLTAAIGVSLLFAAVLAGMLWLYAQPAPTTALFEDYAVHPHTIDRHRQLIWIFAISKIFDASLFGYGIDAINKIPGANTVIPFLGSEYMPSHPHNWMLEVFAETGVLGFLALLAALILMFARMCALPREATVSRYAMAALFGTYFGTGLSSFSFWASWWQLVFIILWAFCDVTHRRSQR